MCYTIDTEGDKKKKGFDTMARFTPSQIKNFLIIKKSGKETFYASDFGFNGGEIGALASGFFIERTGKTKKKWVQVTPNKKIKADVYEWRIRHNFKPWHSRLFGESVADIFKAAELLKEFGFE